MAVKLINEKKKKYRVAFWYKNRHYTKVVVYGNQRLAKAVEAKMKLELAEGTYLPGKQKNDVTFSEVAERFIKEFAAYRPTHDGRKYYEYGARKAKEFFGNKKLSEFTSEDIRRYRNFLSTQGKDGQGYHSVSTNHFHKVARRIFSWAIQCGLFKGENPASGTKVKLESELKYWHNRYVTQEELERLIQVTDARLKPLIYCAVFTGLRYSELKRMKKKDINLDTCTVAVPVSKNGDPGSVPLPDALFSILEPLIKQLPHPDSLVLDFGNFQRLWKEAREKAKLTDITFHSLRHSYASHLLMASGGDMAAVQRLMRLKTPQLLLRYGHLAPGHLRNVANTLNNQLALSEQKSHTKPQNDPCPITKAITPVSSVL